MSFTLSYINYNIQSPKKILFYKRIIHRVLYSIYFLRSKLNKFSDKSGIQFFGCMRNGRCIRQTTQIRSTEKRLNKQIHISSAVTLPYKTPKEAELFMIPLTFTSELLLLTYFVRKVYQSTTTISWHELARSNIF